MSSPGVGMVLERCKVVRLVVARIFAITIGIVVMVHSGLIAMGPHGQHGREFDADHTPVLELVCDESEAVTAASRVPLDPVICPSLSAGVSRALPDNGASLGNRWAPPFLTGETLRALLQGLPELIDDASRECVFII